MVGGSVVAPTTSASSGETLSASTSYHLYIRSDCDTDGVSGWLGPLGITTLSDPPPVNDFCDGAIFLLQETNIPDAASATANAGSLLGGAGTDVDAESCTGSANARDDVWYSFLAQTTDVTITLEPQFDGIITLFSGDCNSLVQLDCSDANGGLVPRTETLAYGGLVVGQTYYTRVYFQGFTTASPSFDLKIWTSSTIVDDDNDNYSNDVDCNDIDPAINPGAIEVCDGVDNNCDGSTDEGFDADSDGVADCFDICPGFDDNDDADGDGVPDGCDICPGFDDTADADGDGVPDGCDICPGFDDTADADGDGVPDGCDICPGFDDNIDTDGDGIPDGCDILGTDDFSIQNISVRPNPFKQGVSIHLPSGLNNERFEIILYDLNGKLIFNRNRSSLNGRITIQDLNHLNTGPYFIKITHEKDGKYMIKQLIKY